MLSSIFASVAVAPLASSTPFPLSAKTLNVVPPVPGLIGVALKSSLLAVTYKLHKFGAVPALETVNEHAASSEKAAVKLIAPPSAVICTPTNV